VEDDVDKSRLDDETVVVGFELPAAVAAGSVTVCGDFNDWSPQSHPLTRVEGGSFHTDVALPAGRRWRFRYLLDGERWENDWAADDYVPNGHGQDDSVVDLTDTAALPLPLPADGPVTNDTVAGRIGSAAAAVIATGDVTTSEPATAETTTDEATDGTATRAGAPQGRWRRWWHSLTGRGSAGPLHCEPDAATESDLPVAASEASEPVEGDAEEPAEAASTPQFATTSP
jgi:Carbohydrate-binding module 48 (Isoamylase N-terminal domain)